MEQVNYERVKGRLVYRSCRRAVDLTLSALGLVALSPLLTYLALIIKREDGGPVLYSQTRLGKDGVPFRLWKFRSMVVNADDLKKQLADQNEVAGAMFKMARDPRITKVGKRLRRHSLDELPQLFNVLKGDMALIGPRPPLPEEAAQYSAYDRQRLLVKPGCSGLWQVKCRNAGDFDQMVQLDLKYINRSSLWTDLGLILQTIALFFKPNGM
ncbi:MAG: sugar transferase [Lacticaseibacillus absianus]